MTLFHYDAQNPDPQYLEDLATGYWFSEVLFTAIEIGVFTQLEPDGKTTTELSAALGLSPSGIGRFLNALCAMGLLTRHEDRYFNTAIAGAYLVEGKPHYQGDSILWRKELTSHWKGLRNCLESGGRLSCAPETESDAGRPERIRRYINAMDSVAKTKGKEILSFFSGLSLTGELLDVGAGSGAIAAGFLDHGPSLKATLMDMPEVLACTREFIQAKRLSERTRYCEANILEPWPVEKARFDIVILSNIIHAYSEKELPHILANAAGCLKEEGLMVIHDFFLEHHPRKAALFDLNMFINTYNGRVFLSQRVMEELSRLRLFHTDLLPLETDTALIFASKSLAALSRIPIDPRARLASAIKGLGFADVLPIPVESIHIPDWADQRCRFGCDRYGSPHCPPHALSPETTRAFIRDYRFALLLEGEPPTREFQQRILQAEKEAFKAGFYKAFAYWAGPCSICASCAEDGDCRNTKDARPSMEGAGIDVYETVRRVGIGLRTLDSRSGFVKYFGLLLVE